MPVATASELRAKTLDPLFRDPAVERALNMMSLDPYLTQDNILLWIEAVGQIESGGGKNTSNKERVGKGGTSAKGNYQFTDETYRSYLQSAANAYKDVGSSVPEWVTKELKNSNRDPRSLSDNQQRILLIVGTHARGKDADMQKAWGEGDLLGAGKKLFYGPHYGGTPDRKTIQVVNREFNKIKDRVVTLAPDSSDADPIKTGMAKRKMGELTDYEATFPNEVDRKKLEDTLQEVRVDAERVLEPIIPTKRGQVPIPEPKVEVDPVEKYLNRVIVSPRAGRFPEVTVDAKRVPEQALAEVTVPKRAGKVDEVTVPQREQKQIPAPYTDYTTAMDQRLTDVTVPQREPVVVPPRSTPRLESELAATQMEAMQPVPTVTPTVDPIAKYLNRVTAQKVELGRIDVPKDPVEIYFANKKARQARDIKGLLRVTAQGFGLGFGEELESFITGRDVKEIRSEMDEFSKMNPRIAFYGELLPGIGTGVGVARTLTKAGVTSLGAQGAIELGVYGVGTGETAVERLEQGLLFAATGGILGKALDALIPSSSDILSKSTLVKNKSKETVAVDDTPVTVNTPEEITEKARELYDIYRPQLAARSQSKTLPKPKKVEGGYEYGGVFISGTRQTGYDVPGVGKVESLDEVITAVDEQFVRFTKEIEELQVEFVTRKQLANELEFPELKVLDKAKDFKVYKMGRSASKPMGKVGTYFDTAEDTLYYNVSPQLAGDVKIAAEDSLREMNNFFDDFVVPLAPVVQAWRTNTEAAKAMLDYARGLDKRQVFLGRLKKAGLTNEDIVNVVNYLDARAKVFANQRFNLGKEALPSTDRLHVQVISTQSDDIYAKKSGRDFIKVQQDQSKKALKNRARATDEMLKDYQNPFLTDFRLLNQNSLLNNISKRMDVGSLGTGQPAGEKAFTRMAQRLAQDLPDEVAERGVNIIYDIVAGAQMIPPAWAQLLSTLSYGGTLMSFKSAVLNLHDAFVSPMLNGVSATIKGTSRAFQSGKSYVDPLTTGLNRQTQGEYAQKLMDNLADMAGDVNAIRKANRAAAKGLEKGMKWTLFSGMDTIGKRVVMNSVIENGYNIARQGKFKEKWGGYFTEKEMYRMVNAFRKHGTNLEAMSDKELELLTTLAYAGLGQQQLISIAGRPLAWSLNPNLRPFYTLMGFAIVQRSLLRRKVLDNLLDGNIKDAAKFSALYIASAGVGYAVLDEARDFIFSAGEDPITGEELLFKALVDQPLSVLTLNKAPTSTYQYNRFKANPYEYAVTAIAPAGGLIEQGGSAGIDLITGDVDKAFKHIMQIPALKNSIGLAIELLGEPTKEE